MSAFEELRSRFPSIEWDEPVRIKVPGGPPGRWVCRFCIALHGFKAVEIDACPFAYATRLEAVAHIASHDSHDGPRRCKQCEHGYGGWPEGNQVVSPSGVEHIGADFGVMLCGRDGTGDGWWWPE